MKLLNEFENRIYNFITEESNFVKILFGVFTLTAIVIRVVFRNFVTEDMTFFFVPWFNHIKTHGGPLAWGDIFSDYSPPYTYFLTIASYLPARFPPAQCIKMVSCLFDFLMAYVAMRLVALKNPNDTYSQVLVYGLVLLCPTVVMDSAMWGQSDVIYTTFLLLTVFYIAKEKPLWAGIFFGVALSIKFQTIFWAPSLVVFYFYKRIQLVHIVVVPVLVYVVVVLPAWIAGRDLDDLLLHYFRYQIGNKLNYPFRDARIIVNFPNLFGLYRKHDPTAISMGMYFALSMVMLLIALLVRYLKMISTKEILLISVLFLFVVPFFLPQMHERYWYPATIFSIVLTFHAHRYWYLALGLQFINFITYYNYLFSEDESTYKFLIPISFGLLFKLMYDLRQEFHVEVASSKKIKTSTASMR